MRIVNYETLDFTGFSEWSYVQVHAADAGVCVADLRVPMLAQG